MGRVKIKILSSIKWPWEGFSLLDLKPESLLVYFSCTDGKYKVTRCRTQREKGTLAKDKLWGLQIVLEMVQP